MAQKLRFFSTSELDNSNSGGLLLQLDLAQSGAVGIPRVGDNVVLPIRHEAGGREHRVSKVVHKIQVDDPGVDIYVD